MSDQPLSPTDSEFRYIGFSEHQISTLRGHSNAIRHIVYSEGLRLMMESQPGESLESQTALF